MILDLFAGPGGWSEALRALGTNDIGIEWDGAACETRAAAGHLTIRADVATYPTEPFVGKVVGLIASPPCPTFSAAGKGEGNDEFPHLHSFADEFDGRGWFDPWSHHAWSDRRTPLVLEPLRWVEALHPEWVALEQVPAVLPLCCRCGRSTPPCGPIVATRRGLAFSTPLISVSRRPGVVRSASHIAVDR